MPRSLEASTAAITVRIGSREWEATCVRLRDTSQGHTGDDHLVLLHGMDLPTSAESAPHPEVPVRIHSECLLGDVFAADQCDCRSQLDRAVSVIEQAGRGMIIYLRQEGRGIGLYDKIRSLLEDGDTFQRNKSIGCPADARGYRLAAEVLLAFGIQKVRLLSGNPTKIGALESAGLEVVPDGTIHPADLTERAFGEIEAKLRRGYQYYVPGFAAKKAAP